MLYHATIPLEDVLAWVCEELDSPNKAVIVGYLPLESPVPVPVLRTKITTISKWIEVDDEEGGTFTLKSTAHLGKLVYYLWEEEGNSLTNPINPKTILWLKQQS